MSKKTQKYYQTVRCGEHWATLTIEWSETGCTEQRNEMAAEIADGAFSAGAPKVRNVVQALMGNWKA